MFFLQALGVFAIILLIIAALTIFIVPENKLFIIARFGKFHKIAHPGLNFKWPDPIESIQGDLDLQVLFHNVIAETKTQDNVFVNIHCSIQYRVLRDKAFEAFYALDDVTTQLESYVFDTIRAVAPKLTLDKLFEEKETIANEVKISLDHLMGNFGMQIIKTLITHIDPDSNVKRAMNEINAAERERTAAQHRAEAEKLVVIKAAEAQKESRILQGEGIAGQRKAIIHGLRESLNELQNGEDPDNSITEQEAINLLLINQYFDTLKDIGAHAKSNAIFLNHNHFDALELNKSSSSQDLKRSLLEAILSADIVKTDIKKN